MATMAQLNTAVIILNYKGLENTLECLESLRKCSIANMRLSIIVVENGSQDGSAESLSKIKDIELITSEDNLGFSGGMNLGIKFAISRNTDYIIILNNDTYVDKNLITSLVKSARNAEIVVPKIYFAPGYEYHESRYKKSDLGKVIWYAGGLIDWQNVIGIHRGVDEVDKGQFKRKSITFATGCCMLVSQEVFAKIGLLDEKYFLYLEDMDFSYRAQKAGFKILFEPKAIVWHKNAAAAGGSGSSLQDYYFTRNRLLFAAKYAKLGTKLALLKHVVTQASDPIKRKALLDFLTFHYGKKNF